MDKVFILVLFMAILVAVAVLFFVLPMKAMYVVPVALCCIGCEMIMEGE